MKDDSLGSLADKVINQITIETEREGGPQYPNQWGIDNTGFPWPNPVNSQAVAIRVFSKWGKANGVDNIFKIEGDIFLGRKKLQQNKQTLLSLYEKPKIVVWANTNADMQDEEELWVQIKRVISSEWPIVWAVIREVAPEYSREYIRVTQGLVWGKDESDLLIM